MDLELFPYSHIQKGGQFNSARGGQFTPASGGHFGRFFHTYLIVAQVKYALKSILSVYEIMQILGISVFDKTPVKELLAELNIDQNFKEQGNLFSVNNLLTH